jgi:hypothetical protein
MLEAGVVRSYGEAIDLNTRGCRMGEYKRMKG